MGKGGDLASATAIDGESYTALPAAFKFEKSFEATCTCKPPNQTWVQALAEAEKLLGDERKGDVTVTAKISDELAKPKATPVPDPKVRGRGQKTPVAAMATPLPDQNAATEGLRGSQAPTATNASAGIAQSPAQSAAVVKEGAGPTRQVKGPDGVSRTVRIIVP